MRNILLLLCCCFPLFLFAQLPSDFYQETIIEDFDRPVGITFDANGQGYLWSQEGKVWLFDADGAIESTPFLDISEEVLNWKDHGLVGFALDNNYLANGYVYLLYAADRHHVLHYGTANYNPNTTIEGQATIGRVTRYTADSSTGFKNVLPESRKVLLGTDFSDGIPILMISHGVGDIAMAKDRTLLVSCGDSGAYESADAGSHERTYFEQALSDGILDEGQNLGSYRALMLHSMNGKVLRIDAETGDGLPSNPYYQAGAARADASRVWLTGFRNPFRFVVDEETGAHTPEEGDAGILYIGDVGAGSWEELNVATQAGQCFGWPIYEAMEGRWEFDAYAQPNPESPNPLFGVNGCTQEFLNFGQLIQQPKKQGEPTFTNPCDASEFLPASVTTFVHRPPATAWSNAEWNKPDRAIIPNFNEAGELKPFSILEEASNVEGDDFGGYSSVPGFLYRDGNFPEKYENALFVSDLVGWIKAFYFDENNALQRIEAFHETRKGITDLAMNPTNGCIYYTQIYDNEIHRICYGGNPKPIVNLQLNQYYGTSPLMVEFDASNSYAPKGYPVSYTWDFGDGSTSESANPSHTFEAANGQAESFHVTLTITDSLGTSASETRIVSVNNTPPDVAISSFENGAFYAMNGVTILPLEAQVSDAEHSAEELHYEWETFLHHNAHFHPDPKITKKSSTFLLDPIGCQAENYWYRVRLTVTDAQGLSSTDERELFPYCEEAFVEFLNVKAEKTAANSVLLTWENPIEEKVQAYEIQRTGTYLYETIATVTADASGAYRFEDTAPLAGDNIYRIKAVQEDALYEFSNAVFISFTETLDYVFYPNPTGEAINILLEEALSDEIILQLHDSSGRLIFSKRWAATIGQNFNKRLALSRFANGIYFARIQNGEKRIEEKIVIVY